MVDVQPVTVLVPQKEGMRDKNSLVHCERPHLLQGDVPNAPAPGYCATAGFRFEMGFLLSSVQWHPAIKCFSAGLGDLTGDSEDLGKPPSGYCRGGIHGIGRANFAGVGGCACGEKRQNRSKNLGRYGLFLKKRMK